jgi:TolB-like protein
MSEPSSSAEQRDQQSRVASRTGLESHANPIWRRIREHKIIQWALGYLAAALALTHSEELIARAFDWPEFVSRALIVVLALGLPVAITLAWYHGHRASRHVSGAEASILAVLLLIGSGILWLFVRPHERQPVAQVHAVAPATQSASPTAPTSSKPRIAILPFENLSPDPANAFFTDGLHEEIISTLSSHARGLEVISRTTMMTYRTPKPVEEIARVLGATHVLEGSVRREGDTVRLTLQLINARSDQHLWSQDYDRTLKSALTLQSEVANEVAAQLAVQLVGTSEFEPITHDPEAYDLYLKAAAAVLSPDTPLEQMQRQVQLYTEALAHDSGFARAYAHRAGNRIRQLVLGWDTAEHAIPLAEQDLNEAERLAPIDPDVLFTKGNYLDIVKHDPTGAIAAFEAAGAGLNPVLLAVSAETYESAGRYDEAVRRAQLALELDPKNGATHAQLMLALLLTRQSAKALRVCNLAATEFPEEFEPWREYIIWSFTGSGSPRTLGVPGSSHGDITAGSSLIGVKDILVPLRLQHRYQEMAAYLAHASARTIRSYRIVPSPPLGAYPVAELRGWVHLLEGSPAEAAQDGKEVLDFVAHTAESNWNHAWLKLLSAEGSAFSGRKTQAVAEATEALALSQSYGERHLLPPIAAAVYAWSGAADDADALLEQASTEIPMITELGPAAIARDPLYTVPLAGNARYKALQAKLEAQMAATKLE